MDRESISPKGQTIIDEHLIGSISGPSYCLKYGWHHLGKNQELFTFIQFSKLNIEAPSYFKSIPELSDVFLKSILFWIRPGLISHVSFMFYLSHKWNLSFIDFSQVYRSISKISLVHYKLWLKIVVISCYAMIIIRAILLAEIRRCV